MEHKGGKCGRLISTPGKTRIASGKAFIPDKNAQVSLKCSFSGLSREIIGLCI